MTTSQPARIRSDLGIDVTTASRLATAATRNAVASAFSPAAAELADAADLLRRGTEGDANADAATVRCNCLVSAVGEYGAERGELMSSAEGDAFFAACMLAPDDFEKALADQKVNVEACKPWWKRRSTKVAVGVVGVLLIAGIVIRRRRK